MKLLILTLFFSIGFAATWKVLVDEKYDPLTHCEGTGDSVTWDGAEWKIVDDSLKKIGWTRGVDYEYECTSNFQDMIGRTQNDADVLGAVGGITITADRLNNNVDFSYTTIRSGLILLVHGENRTGLFSFFDMFEVWLWLAIIGVTVVVAHLIWLFERDEHEEEYPKSYWHGIKEGLWYSCSMLFFANDKPLKSLPARIVALAFWMMMVIIIASYTANLTILITEDLVRIDSINEIDGLIVHCHPIYASAVAKYNPYIKQRLLDDHVILDQSLESLDSYDISAIVVEKLPGQYVGADNCDVLHTKDAFYDFNYGMVFGEEFPHADQEKISEALLSLHQDVEYMKDLEEDYITDVGSCEATESEHQLDFVYFLGLWILLAGAIFIAGVILAVDVFIKWKRSKNKTVKTETKEEAMEALEESEGEALKKALEEQAELIAELKKLV